jgi:hypothetical protein
MIDGGKGSKHYMPVCVALIEQFHLFSHLKMIKKSIYPNNKPKNKICGIN